METSSLPLQTGHHQTIERLADQLDTHLQNGLAEDQARDRRTRLGPNELRERPRPGFLRLLLGQFEDFLVILLILASVVSLLLGETVDAIAILAIVTLNAGLGVFQESRAERSLAALRKMAAPNAIVMRGGKKTVVPSADLVPGDIVILEAGNYVPADLRLVESVNLKVNESALTGESVPVQKDAQVILDKDIPIGDRANSAFMGSMITYGRGRGRRCSAAWRNWGGRWVWSAWSSAASFSCTGPCGIPPSRWLSRRGWRRTCRNIS
jgi:Ca2+-transporting ATPase